MKNIKIIITACLLIFFIFNVSKVYAADFNIVCDDSGCSGFSGPVFNEADILPGDGVSRSIEVRNDRDEDLNISMEISKADNPDDEFSEIVETDIDKDSSAIYSGDLAGTFGSAYDLGVLSVGDPLMIDISLGLPSSAGNEYQDQSVIFDLTLVITGEESGETEVVSTNTSSENDNDDNNEEGSVLGDSKEDETLMGQILGLSNTSSGRKILAGSLIGSLLFVIGINFIFTSLKKKRSTTQL